jgi:hypothetical protein
MSDNPEYKTSPNCGNTRAKSEMLVNEWIGICTEKKGGCGRFWSVESGISYGFTAKERLR